MGTLPKKLTPYPIKSFVSEQTKMSEYLSQIIPPYIPETSVTAKAKNCFRTVLRMTITIFAVFILVSSIFLTYRVVKNRDTFWHYLKHDRTIAVTLTNQKTMQDAAIDDTLAQLTKPGKTLQQKLVEITASGYAQNDWYQERIVVYDEKLRSNYQMTFEGRVQVAIDKAYSIYNNFDPETEREVYGIATDELVYQKGLRVAGYAPMTLRNSLYEGRRYLPFALIAGQIANIDPLHLLKIFEIETNFNETTVGRNTDQIINDDIGIAQNNLVVLPSLIRDILDPDTPVYSPFFECLNIGLDLETGEPLTWSTYLVRLEDELKGTHNRQKDPTGRYYINLLKAPHIGAFLAAYHIKRDQTYRLYPECMNFYRKNAAILKRELKLSQDLNPYHWTDYSFYNGGPKRWYVMRKFLMMRQNHQSIPPELKEAVQITKRRNRVAQKIGKKNEYLRSLAFDLAEDEIIENDGLFRYGLYDFTPNFKSRELMYNLNRDLAVAPKQ